MKYEKVIEGKFISRPNRFIAEVSVAGKTERAHVKNTGRLGELLIPGVRVYLEDHGENMGKRKLRYSLIGTEKQTENGAVLVNLDSQAPNRAVKEALEEGKLKIGGIFGAVTSVRAEAVYGDSRIDFKVSAEDGAEAYIEVKGVTLESGGTAYFPDAPTERGIKHLRELERAAGEGKKAAAVFVIQMNGVRLFKPNDDKHRAFGEALRHAALNGVEVLAFDCVVSKNSMELGNRIRIEL